MTILDSQCFQCKFFHDEDAETREVEEPYRCDAFSEKGIPNDILFNKVAHTKPYEGDGGIQFEQRAQ